MRRWPTVSASAGIKEELEETAFRYLNPQEYEDISRRLAASKEDREAYVQEVADALEADLKKSSLDVRIMGRTKTIPSIHRKLVTQNVTIDQIYDITALRIITDSVRDCYAVLGVIHTLWMPIPGRFKDFVALPKANMYQSIHTTVLGPSGHRVEFQVRTAEMHSVAESGIAAHWLYKEGRPQEEREDERFNWLRQLLEWQKEVLDPKEYMHTLRTDLFQEEVYVFTPNGRVIELPRDATPVDFAYLIHTDIGNHCARRQGERKDGSPQAAAGKRRDCRDHHLAPSKTQPGLVEICQDRARTVQDPGLFAV